MKKCVFLLLFLGVIANADVFCKTPATRNIENKQCGYSYKKRPQKSSLWEEFATITDYSIVDGRVVLSLSNNKCLLMDYDECDCVQTENTEERWSIGDSVRIIIVKVSRSCFNYWVYNLDSGNSRAEAIYTTWKDLVSDLADLETDHSFHHDNIPDILPDYSGIFE